MLLRGAVKHCARCGSGRLFATWFTMKDTCPRCELEFAHEEGYWTGAMMVNLAVTEALFLIVFVVSIVAMWPDVNWVAVLVVVVALNVITPIVFYPFSKTLWVAGDLSFRKHDRDPGSRYGPA